MFRFAGVTVDFYDDGGALIKQRFPTLDELPDVIKAASVKDANELPNESFALVAIDEGNILRKFACNDAGTTAMSVMYFMENKDKLPEDAKKHAAHNLFEQCIFHNLLPPKELTKIAKNALVDLTSPTGAMEQVQERRAADAAVNELLNSPEAKKTKIAGDLIQAAGTIDITGQRPKAKFASAPMYDEDYAVVSEGKRMYPIHDWDHLKLACDYWSLESRRMHPEMRREFAVKVAAKAHQLGYLISDPTIVEIGSPVYADESHIKTAMDMRKSALPGSENAVHREFMDELFEKKAELHPEVFAECIRRFDVMNDLESGWDQLFPSPWESTFGMQKIAKVVWESGPDRVTDEELNNLARNHSGGLNAKFADHFVKGFENDPIGIFDSMPLPQKIILARLAADMASRGGSMMSSYNGMDPTKTVGQRPTTKLAE